MNKIFHTKKTLTFKEADPAGIMFFGNIFGFAHDAFEEFIQAAGYTYQGWFGQRDLIIPIRHTESDFLSPFFPGQTYDIAVTVASFGETSFKMKYVFSQNGKKNAVVQMVHSVVDGKTKQKAPLTVEMKSRLEPYLEAVKG
ncbi:MAG: thioesterase [Bdellovibrio sp. ArHS]|uniref:acyl-CoA thioesterase n=1 Tax=Bdellovibrio sp. ArHS TaxID=1569284 RepID=UPI000583F380|nr:acyl-CoA thioesterase [Bdellovibrio sp. ArHS]KHD89702.1 MAG: thioesterase [Bdellovibrio sp. ArHS]